MRIEFKKTNSKNSLEPGQYWQPPPFRASYGNKTTFGIATTNIILVV